MKTIKFFHPVLPELGVEIFTIMITWYFCSVLIVLKEIFLFIKFQKITFWHNILEVFTLMLCHGLPSHFRHREPILACDWSVCPDSSPDWLLRRHSLLGERPGAERGPRRPVPRVSSCRRGLEGGGIRERHKKCLGNEGLCSKWGRCHNNAVVHVLLTYPKT